MKKSLRPVLSTIISVVIDFIYIITKKTITKQKTNITKTPVGKHKCKLTQNTTNIFIKNNYEAFSKELLEQ